MATKAQEVQVLRDGIQANAPTPGSFALNMLHSNNCWQVREGFGQVTQFDTEMSAVYSGAATSEWGFIKHLGSHLIKTNFGNLQMLSVFLTKGDASEAGGPLISKGYAPLGQIYVVSVYDLTTNERFEVPLYPHTSQAAAAASFGDSVPTTTGGRTFEAVAVSGMDDLLPQYQTCFAESYESWLQAEDEFFYFEEFADILYFGNSYTGTWAYLPASFNGTRKTFIDKFNLREYAYPYGESSMITPVVLSPGVNVDAYEYFRTADMPNAVDVAVVQGRMVYAEGHTVFFSDPFYPNAIVADNYADIPSEEGITAIAEHNSNLVIFTANETWLYQPAVGDLAAGGRITRVSDTVGCVGPNAKCRMGAALVWVDTSGVYQTTSGLNMSRLSDDVLPFFEREGMTNPLTSYFVDHGKADPSAREQPTTTLRFKPEGVKCTYVASMNMLSICVPDLSGALVLSNGKWSWWTFESMVAQAGGEAVVGVSQNLPAPWVLNYQDGIFAVAGPDVQALTDEAVNPTTGNDVNFDVASRSFFIMEYGRGGAIDRSVSDEDDRKVTGYGQVFAASGSGAVAAGGFYFGDPIKVPDDYVFPSGVTTASSGEFFLVPVTTVNPTALNANKIRLGIAFDNTHWKPVFNHASNSDVELILPTERLASALGWGSTGSYAGAIKSYSSWNSTTGAFSVASQSGSFIEILFDASGAGTTGWYHAPYLNLNQYRPEPLIYLPFRRITDKADEDVSGMSITLLTTTGGVSISRFEDTASTHVLLPLHVFNRWSLATTSKRKEDSVAQPVDWAYKSTNVGLEGGNELKMRGLWANLLSHGTGTDKLDSVWPYGTFNTLVGSDRKEWMTQVIDATPAQAAVEQAVGTNTLRTRVQKTDGALVDKVFQSGGTGIVWANKDAARPDLLDGTVLIGDEDTSDIAVSMSVKGQSFSVMNFGFIMNRAEKLWLEGVKAVFRVVGGRRRRGR
jgi:hypothetical protein